MSKAKKPEVNEKLSALDPRFRKRFEELLESMNQSISILYEEVIRDQKTRIYNNRFFDHMFEIEFEKAKRGKQKLSLLMIDIDHFKKLNDTYGHVKGDEILIKLASVLRKTARKSDIVARYGGEEFIALFPHSPISTSRLTALRMGKKIKNDPLLKKYKVTVSMGLSEFNPHGDSRKSMITRADKALYKAKERGRDQLVIMKNQTKS